MMQVLGTPALFTAGIRRESFFIFSAEFFTTELLQGEDSYKESGQGSSG